MKNILLLTITIALFSSCDEGYGVINYIENKTDSLIVCDFYRNDIVDESYRIEANSKLETYNGNDNGSPGFDIYVEADKIRIEGYGDSVIWLYPYTETNFKSLFDRDNWEKELEGEDRYISTYIFE